MPGETAAWHTATYVGRERQPERGTQVRRSLLLLPSLMHPFGSSFVAGIRFQRLITGERMAEGPAPCA